MRRENQNEKKKERKKTKISSGQSLLQKQKKPKDKSTIHQRKTSLLRTRTDAQYISSSSQASLNCNVAWVFPSFFFCLAPVLKQNPPPRRERIRCIQPHPDLRFRHALLLQLVPRSLHMRTPQQEKCDNAERHTDHPEHQ